MSRRRQAFRVWVRFLDYHTVPPRWTKWYPQFDVYDAQTDRNHYSPRTQVRNLLIWNDQHHADATTALIRAKKRPGGQSWRITLLNSGTSREP